MFLLKKKKKQKSFSDKINKLDEYFIFLFFLVCINYTKGFHCDICTQAYNVLWSNSSLFCVIFRTILIGFTQIFLNGYMLDRTALYCVQLQKTTGPWRPRLQGPSPTLRPPSWQHKGELWVRDVSHAPWGTQPYSHWPQRLWIKI
jgi:hypothetical protein